MRVLRKKNLEALNAVLRSAPLNSKNQQLKDSTFQLVMRVLRSFQNSAEIDNAVKSLDQNGVDVLMKYIYKGFEREPRDSSHLLTWHEKVWHGFWRLLCFLFINPKDQIWVERNSWFYVEFLLL